MIRLENVEEPGGEQCGAHLPRLSGLSRFLAPHRSSCQSVAVIVESRFINAGVGVLLWSLAAGTQGPGDPTSTEYGVPNGSVRDTADCNARTELSAGSLDTTDSCRGLLLSHPGVQVRYVVVAPTAQPEAAGARPGVSPVPQCVFGDAAQVRGSLLSSQSSREHELLSSRSNMCLEGRYDSRPTFRHAVTKPFRTTSVLSTVRLGRISESPDAVQRVLRSVCCGTLRP